MTDTDNKAAIVSFISENALAGMNTTMAELRSHFCLMDGNRTYGWSRPLLRRYLDELQDSGEIKRVGKRLVWNVAVDTIDFEPIIANALTENEVFKFEEYIYATLIQPDEMVLSDLGFFDETVYEDSTYTTSFIADGDRARLLVIIKGDGFTIRNEQLGIFNNDGDFEVVGDSGMDMFGTDLLSFGRFLGLAQHQFSLIVKTAREMDLVSEHDATIMLMSW